MVETAEEKQRLGKLILEALACNSFDMYHAIQQRWEDLSEQTAQRYLDDPDSPQSECYHQYMQINAYVVDDHGKARSRLLPRVLFQTRTRRMTKPTRTFMPMFSRT